MCELDPSSESTHTLYVLVYREYIVYKRATPRPFSRSVSPQPAPVRLTYSDMAPARQVRAVCFFVTLDKEFRKRKANLIMVLIRKYYFV